MMSGDNLMIFLGQFFSLGKDSQIQTTLLFRRASSKNNNLKHKLIIIKEATIKRMEAMEMKNTTTNMNLLSRHRVLSIHNLCKQLVI